ncbi:MAG: hypothetical protein ABIM50_03765 [Novosphingobium sp.]
MGQAYHLDLNPEVLATYQELAKAHGRSLEDELSAVIEANRPLHKKCAAELRRMSDDALALTPPDGPDGSDSTILIRWDRDTNHGKWVDDGWSDDDAGG